MLEVGKKGLLVEPNSIIEEADIKAESEMVTDEEKRGKTKLRLKWLEMIGKRWK